MIHNHRDPHSQMASEVPLEIAATRALFEGQADGWIVGLFANERPPQGLAGLLDWHLHGWISQSVRQGIFEGKAGECAYLPTSHQGKTLHLLLAGMGARNKANHENPLPASTLKALEKNITSLGRTNWGVSLNDLGAANVPALRAAIGKVSKGGQLWTSP